MTQSITGNKAQHQTYLTILNIVACLGVVMLHTNVAFWSHPTGSAWLSATLIETLMYWPVPIFFMITGATLLEYRDRYSTRVFMKKRFVKTFIPFIFWSIVAFYAQLLWQAMEGQEIKQWFPNIIDIFNYKYKPIYWFFIPLFAIYLSMPLLNLLKDRWRLIRYLILYAFLSYSMLPFLQQAFNLQLDSYWRAPVVAGYILYVLLGYYLSRTQQNKKARIVIYALGLIGLSLHFCGTYFLTPNYGGSETINTLFKGYLNFPCILYSVAVFVFFKHINYAGLQNKRHAPIINSLHASTLGIYLIHIYVIDILTISLHINQLSLTWRIFGPLLIFLLSFLLVQLLKRLPLLKSTVP